LAHVEKLLTTVFWECIVIVSRRKRSAHISSNLTDSTNPTVKRWATNRIRSYNLGGKSLSDVLVKSNILSSINYIEGELYLFNHLLTKWYKGILEIGLYSHYLYDI